MTTFEYAVSPILLVELSILTLLVMVAVAMLRSRHLFAVVMLSGIYSLLSAAFFVSLDAVDVAFTEAAVGAGVSTVLMLAGMLLTARREKPFESRRVPVARLAVFATGAALIYATIDMPAFGDPNAPANAHVGLAYIEETPSDIAVPNIVTAVLASYRGFDTLGEVLVVYTAGLAVILLLGVGSARGGRSVSDTEEEKPQMGHLILRVTTKLLFAPIILFALYVQFHGDYGPGGGFQAGVIFAVAFILHAFCFGLEETKKAVPQKALSVAMVIGVLFYAGTGVATMLLGGNFLAYDQIDPDSTHHAGQHYGIILVEWGVGVTVASTMLTIFYHFTGREPDIDQEDW